MLQRVNSVIMILCAVGAVLMVPAANTQAQLSSRRRQDRHHT